MTESQSFFGGCKEKYPESFLSWAAQEPAAGGGRGVPKPCVREGGKHRTLGGLCGSRGHWVLYLYKRAAEDSLTQLKHSLENWALKSGSSWLLWHKIIHCLQDLKLHKDWLKDELLPFTCAFPGCCQLKASPNVILM